jgi:anti-sigma B factor antagonist
MRPVTARRYASGRAGTRLTRLERSGEGPTKMPDKRESREMSMTGGTVRFANLPNILIARMSGEIDLSNAEQLGVEIVGATPDDARAVVLDLTAVEHLDSYGIFVIHGLRQRLAESQQALVLIVPSDARIRRAIELVRIGDVIPVHESVDVALNALER